MILLIYLTFFGLQFFVGFGYLHNGLPFYSIADLSALGGEFSFHHLILGLPLAPLRCGP